MSRATAPSPAPALELPAGATISPVQLAGCLGINKITVADWIRRGWLPPPIRIGRTVRWPRAQLVAFFAARS